MEAVATQEPVTTDPTEVEQVVEATSFGINKTNTTQARHHFTMGQQSISRSLTFIEGMTDGRTGSFATTLLEAEKLAYTAQAALESADAVIAGVQGELAELWS